MPSLNQNRTSSRRFFLGAIAASIIATSFMSAAPAFADKLDTLRASGVLGEAFDGFTRAKEKSAKAVSTDINAKRRKIYIKRAKAQKVSVEQVGQVYAAQIAKKAPSGTWLLSKNGSWHQKK
ncbi:MAG: DUF1318 domain-containing protein [Sneathiella sp.]